MLGIIGDKVLYLKSWRRCWLLLPVSFSWLLWRERGRESYNLASYGKPEGTKMNGKVELYSHIRQIFQIRSYLYQDK
jgi:hypothetical protein